ncbi:MAG: hypothetical protein EZS28_044232 [Streblomastix strix]|uniref:Uncharacterized protein n=1 Tax=Streblomastix strix TaxID=222440 RepID=A0A5J4TQM2_9EUKA|nr:MAG: hypothetical protein EZS28_044232 [Streblomastix strix]
MTKAITGRASVQVYHMQWIGESKNNKVKHLRWMMLDRSGENTTLIREWHVQGKNMTWKMPQRHYNQPKLQDRNLEFDSEDKEIDLFHHVVRDQGTTFLTEEMNCENDQDQEGIRDRETIKIREKLE